MENTPRPSDELAPLDAGTCAATCWRGLRCRAGPGGRDDCRIFRDPVVLSVLISCTMNCSANCSPRRHQHPTRTCLIADGVKLTYRDVDRAAERLARGLLHHGAKPGAVIGLWMGRGADLLIAQIAIARTGAAFLPFDADDIPRPSASPEKMSRRL